MMTERNLTSRSNLVSDRPFFIVGCGRSGTSLLRNLLRAHPRLTVPDESHFIPTFYRAYGDPRTPREARKLAGILLKLWWVRKWGLDIRPDSFSDCLSFSAIVSQLFEAYACKMAKVRWGDKTPSYVLSIPTLIELFPDCQIIHIYRDGRDVALSQFRHPSAQSRNAYIAAKVWTQRVSTGRAIGATLLPDQYLEVRYENLLSDPETTLQGVCEFLNEPFTNQVLQPDYLERKAVKRVIGKDHQLDVDKKTIVKTNQQKWKKQMRRHDREVFESIAGPLLEELGYEVEGHQYSPSTLQVMKWKAHQKTLFLAARLNASEKREWVPTHARMRWAVTRHRLRTLGILR